MPYERRRTWGDLISRKDYGNELPEQDGLKHGTFAMVRKGCTCSECMDKRARMRRRRIRRNL